MSDDILMLRKYAFPDGIRDCDAALALMALNDVCGADTPEWTAYFIDSLADFLVRHSEPTDMIDEAKAAWLMRAVAIDGAIRSPLELELVLHAMEIASEVPESLSAFALDQLRLALSRKPRGAYALGRPHAAFITARDLAYVWRILRGALERGRLILSPLEALVLREIDDCANPADNHPAWREMIAAIVTLERPDGALRAERWLKADDRQLLSGAAA